MFSIQLNKRINFSELRQHPVFKKYFPNASVESQILYKTKFKSERLKKGKLKNKLSSKVSELRNKTLSPSVISASEETDYERQHQIVKRQQQQIGFLWTIVHDCEYLQGKVQEVKLIMVKYNLVKYYILLLRKYLHSFERTSYSKKYPKEKNLHWKQLFYLPEFNDTKRKECAKKISEAEHTFKELHHKCSYKLEEIKKLNPYFENTFSD